MERARCDAIKQGDGERCTRWATPTGGGRRCTQHARVVGGGGGGAAAINDREPWTALGMPQPHAKNDRRALQKLRAKLRAPLPASQNNEEGYIYVYGIAGERALNYWKVGMTARADAHARVDEWRRAHNKRHAVVLRNQFHTRHPKRVERVIHLYLAYCRMYRYEYEEEDIGNGCAVSGAVSSKFHSVWARDGAVVEDGQQLEAPTPHALAATRKHVEWFCEEYAHIRGVIESVILGTTLQCAREARTASPARSTVQIL